MGEWIDRWIDGQMDQFTTVYLIDQTVYFINQNQSFKTLLLSPHLSYLSQLMDRNIFLYSQSEDYLFLHDPKFQQPRHQDFFPQRNKPKTQILPAQCSTIADSNLIKEKDSTSNKDSSKKYVNSAAGKQAREKKKIYVEGLQTSVTNLQKQILQYEADIKKTKETLAQTLNSTKNDQNSITYSELQLCIESQDPNEDKINLLIDMIQFRIGASGHQRQAKIQYYFKQLINTLFPAIHRYLMYCSSKKLDIFHQESIDEFFEQNNSHQVKEKSLSWTGEFLASLEITESQKSQLLKLTSQYIEKKHQVKKIITTLKEIKENIKNEQEIFQAMIGETRKSLEPIQAASMILFSDKFKYKRELSLEKQGEFDLFTKQDSQMLTSKKKIKLH